MLRRARSRRIFGQTIMTEEKTLLNDINFLLDDQIDQEIIEDYIEDHTTIDGYII